MSDAKKNDKAKKDQEAALAAANNAVNNEALLEPSNSAMAKKNNEKSKKEKPAADAPKPKPKKKPSTPADETGADLVGTMLKTQERAQRIGAEARGALTTAALTPFRVPGLVVEGAKRLGVKLGLLSDTPKTPIQNLEQASHSLAEKQSTPAFHPKPTPKPHKDDEEEKKKHRRLVP